jgi:hypothetical protein
MATYSSLTEYSLTNYIEYIDGVFLDLTADMNTGRPAIASFSLSGSDMLSATVNGLGGQDGKTSGVASTSVMGSSYHVAGYFGVGVFNPYRSFILEESIS